MSETQVGETQVGDSTAEHAIKTKVDDIYYDLIPEMVQVCRVMNFEQADELLEHTSNWEDPFMVRCTDSSWKVTTISVLSDEVGDSKEIRLFTVRFMGGPGKHTLYEAPAHIFVADRVLRSVQHWGGDCDDIIEFLATYWAEHIGALDDA